jgi:transposase
MGVAIGVDSRKSSCAAAALDELGRVVGAREFPNDTAGRQSLLKWAITQGEDRIIGVEWAGSYGAGPTRHLLDAGEDVYDVTAFLTHRERARNPSRGEACEQRLVRVRPHPLNTPRPTLGLRVPVQQPDPSQSLHARHS